MWLAFSGTEPGFLGAARCLGRGSRLVGQSLPSGGEPECSLLPPSWCKVPRSLGREAQPACFGGWQTCHQAEIFGEWTCVLQHLEKSSTGCGKKRDRDTSPPRNINAVFSVRL